MEVFFLIGGLVIGAMISALFFNRGLKKRDARIMEAELKLAHEKELSQEKELFHLRKNEEMEASFRSISSKLTQESSEQFVLLAKEVLAKQQVEGLSELQKKETSFKTLVEPMKEMLSGVKDKMEGIEKNYERTFTEVKEHFKYLKSDQEKLQKETANLVKALRLPQVRGRWGEFQLRKVVEMSGMVPHVDFVEQVTTDSDNGQLRPDMLVRLPGSKVIVIDAKTPLQAYMEAVECDNEDERKRHMIHHSKQVRDHIKKLSAKAYWDQFPTSPEFVVLFLPSDAMYQGAVECDPDLIEIGIGQNVLLATPMTLISLLKTVGYGWNQEALATNAKNISLIGKELYDRLSVFVDHMDGVKKGLDRSIESYNKAVGSFESRVFPSTKKLKELGIASEKEAGNLDMVEKIPKGINSFKENN